MTYTHGAMLLLAAVVASFPAAGQTVISTHSGVVYFFEGTVLLGDQPLEQKFGKFPDIGEGRELRTEQGRAEVLLTPGVILRMGENSRLRMLSSSLSDTRVELLDGSAIVETKEAAADTSALVIYKGWKVRVPQRGVYRIDSQPSQLSVFKGEAEVSSGDTADPVAVKEGRVLPLAAVLVTEQSSAEPSDSFDHWAMQRSQAIFEDNATAAQISDDPTSVDSAGLALGGLSYFPPTGIASLGLTSPYGLSFWSPFQPMLSSLYWQSYGLGFPYLGWSGVSPYRLILPRRIGTPTGIGGGVHPGGIGIYRAPPAPRPAPALRSAPHPAAVGVRGGGHR